MPTDPSHQAEVPTQHLPPDCGVSGLVTGPATTAMVTGSSRYPCRLREASDAGLSPSLGGGIPCPHPEPPAVLWWGRGFVHQHRHWHVPWPTQPRQRLGSSPSSSGTPRSRHTLPALQQGSWGQRGCNSRLPSKPEPVVGRASRLGLTPSPRWGGHRRPSRERGAGRAPAAGAQGRAEGPVHGAGALWGGTSCLHSGGPEARGARAGPPGRSIMGGGSGSSK